MRIQKPSSSMVVACLALFVALSGSAYAVSQLPKNSVGTKQLKNGAVTQSKIAPAAQKALRGLQGPPGAKGDPGTQGPVGSTGLKGDSGAGVIFDYHNDQDILGHDGWGVSLPSVSTILTSDTINVPLASTVIITGRTTTSPNANGAFWNCSVYYDGGEIGLPNRGPLVVSEGAHMEAWGVVPNATPGSHTVGLACNQSGTLVSALMYGAEIVTEIAPKT